MRDYRASSGSSPWEPLTIPPRSRLYHLAPIGMNTGLVESSTGYSSRLARAHNITLAVLFGYEIAPLLDMNHLRNSEARSNKNAVLSNSFRTLAAAVNGHGVVADKYTNSLQKLTMRNDLRYTTMLPWKEVIPHRDLLRPQKAWCPECYRGWHRTKADVYDPLIWSIAVVTMCLTHSRDLKTRCPRCNHLQHQLASRAKPGHCSECFAWLGEATGGISKFEERHNNKERDFQRWAYEQVQSLLKAASTMEPSPKKSILASSISRFISASIFKTELNVARASGLSQSAVNYACRGTSLPQLSTLLRISFLIKVPILDLITGVSGGMTHKPIKHSLMGQSPNSQNVRTMRKRRANIHVKRVRKILERQLKKKNPQSVAEVARLVGHCRTAIVRRLPDLCRMVSEYWIEKRREHLNEVKVQLQSYLESDPPQRLVDIASQLRLSRTSLYQYFPQYCRRIAERYERHLRQRRALKKVSFRDEVIRIAKSLHEQGIYPSVREVSKHVPRPIYLRSSKVALAALRDVRRELGLSFTGDIPADGTSA